MRTSNRWSTVAAAAAVVAGLVAACGGAASPPPAASAVGTPLITPDPHLTEPASVDAIFRLIGAAGLHVTPNTATSGPGGEPVKRILATYADWPLVLTQYSSAAALRKVAHFDPTKPPRRGEAPYNVAGLNILVEFGPHITNDKSPAPPDTARQAAMEALVAVLDPLLGPLSQRSVRPLSLPSATGLPSPAVSPAGSAAP